MAQRSRYIRIGIRIHDPERPFVPGLAALWILALAVFGAGCVDLTPPWKAAVGQDAPSVVPPGDPGAGFEDGPGSGAGPSLDAAPTDPTGDVFDGGHSTSDSSLDADRTDGRDASDTPVEVRAIVDGAVGEGGAEVLPPPADAPLGGPDDVRVEKDSKGASRDVARTDAFVETGARVDGNDDANDAHRADGATGTGGAGGAGGTSTSATGSGGAGGTPTGTGGAATGGTGGSSGNANTGCAANLSPDAGDRLGEGLAAYYQCEEATGDTLFDSSGHSADGRLVTGAGGSAGFAYGTGRIGQAVYFSPAHQGYATLPSNLLANAQEATVATWVYVNEAVTWQRIFDFGRPESDGTSKVYMYLAAADDAHGRLHFAISTTGPDSSEQTMDGPVLSTKTWHHVAVVLGAEGGRLYVDGCRVDVNSRMSLRPADLPHPLDYYIGLSQWTRYPVYLEGNIDEFRVYTRALDAEEIQALAKGL